MLEIRPNCECCDRDLPADSLEALICTFECTFCSECATRHFAGICPNCSGELVRRAVRPVAALSSFPAPVNRVVGAHTGCRVATLVS